MKPVMNDEERKAKKKAYAKEYNAKPETKEKKKEYDSRPKVKVLEKNNLVIKTGNRYGLIFYVSALFENGEFVFDEIVDRLKNIKPSYYI